MTALPKPIQGQQAGPPKAGFQNCWPTGVGEVEGPELLSQGQEVGCRHLQSPACAVPCAT